MKTDKFIQLLHRGKPTAWSGLVDSKELKAETTDVSELPKLNLTDKTWDQVSEKMLSWSEKNHGAVYMAVNIIEGWRKKANVTEVCAIVIDGDDIPKPDKWDIEPSAIAQRDERHWHAYWLLEPNQDIQLYGRVSRAVAKKYESDPMVAESSTLLRVPGTMNRKAQPSGDPIPHELVYCEEKRYTLEALIKDMNLSLETEVELSSGFDPNQVDCSRTEVQNFKERLEQMSVPREGNRHAVMLRETMDARMAGMSNRTIFDIAAPVFEAWGKDRGELKAMLGKALDDKIKKGEVKGRSRAKSVFSDSEPILPFPRDVFPDWVSDYADELAFNLDTQPDYAYLGALACIAGIMPHITIQARLDYLVHPNLYIVAVGNKGSCKSPLVKRTLAPLINFQKILDQKHETAMEHYKVEMKRWKATNPKERGDEPEEPPAAITRLATDCTIEAALIDMATNEKENDCSTLTWFPEEMTSMFKAFGKYANSSDEIQYLLKAYDNTYIKKRRAGKDSNVVIDQPRLSVVGTIQPSVMSSDFKDKDDGFVDRWLFFYPEGKKSRDYNNRTINKGIEKAYFEGMKNVAKNDGVSVPFSKEGRQAAQDVVRQIEDLDEYYDVEVSAKWKTHFYKFVLLITVAGLKTEAGPLEVEKAFKLSKYAISHWVRCWKTAQTTKEDLVQEQVLEEVKKHPEGVTARELIRCRLRKFGSTVVKGALNSLKDDNLVKSRTKRRSEVFFAVGEVD